MLDPRPFDSLGRFQNDWLNAHYHFSFSSYRDPDRMGLGALRVWNDDTIQPHSGFDPHGHRDMEIITYVRRGAITHEDSLGNQGRTEAGDVQVMWAGSGITHAEYNREDAETTLFQIWIETAQPGLDPGWAARAFPKEAGGLQVLASGRSLPGHAEALPIHQDAAVLGGVLAQGETATLPAAGRKLYLVVARGSVAVGDLRLGPRDGFAVWDEEVVSLTALEEAEVVVADVA